MARKQNDHKTESDAILRSAIDEMKSGFGKIELAFWLYIYWIGYSTGLFRCDDE